jgi:hypothetical protein
MSHGNSNPPSRAPHWVSVPDHPPMPLPQFPLDTPIGRALKIALGPFSGRPTKAVLSRVPDSVVIDLGGSKVTTFLGGQTRGWPRAEIELTDADAWRKFSVPERRMVQVANRRTTLRFSEADAVSDSILGTEWLNTEPLERTHRIQEAIHNTNKLIRVVWPGLDAILGAKPDDHLDGMFGSAFPGTDVSIALITRRADR